SNAKRCLRCIANKSDLGSLSIFQSLLLIPKHTRNGPDQPVTNSSASSRLRPETASKSCAQSALQICTLAIAAGCRNVSLHLMRIADLIVDLAHQRPIILIVDGDKAGLPGGGELLLQRCAFPIEIQHRFLDLG